MNQIERIIYMEQILDEATGAVASLTAALEMYSGLQAKLNELATYYSSPQWRQDFDDDAAGKLPHDLKRGVLSEDAVYNLLADDAELKKYIKDLPL